MISHFGLGRSLAIIGTLLAVLVIGIGAATPKSTATSYGIPDEPLLVSVLEEQGIYARHDGWLRSSRYVIERLDADMLSGQPKDRPAFYSDVDSPPEFRAVTGDYNNSGYDRGHLACNANHENTAKSQLATFTLANIAPQVPELNRGPWAKLEEQVRQLAKQPDTKAVWIATGTLMLPDKNGTATIKFIGKHNIPVPTHFFKTILCEDKSGYVRLWAILAKNEVPTKSTFQNISVDDLEAMAGLNFWSAMEDKLEAKLESVANDWPAKE